MDIDSCDLLEFGAVVDDLADQKPVEKLPVFHCYFTPPNGQTFQGQPYALSMHPTIFRRIAERAPPYSYVHPNRFGNLFKQFLLKNGYVAEHDRVVITVAGKNFGSGDLQFLNRKTDLPKHVEIRSKILDPAVLLLQKDDLVLPGSEACLERLCRAGVVKSGIVEHNAVQDAIDVIHMTRYGLRHLFPMLEAI